MIRTYTKLPAVGVALLTLLIGLVACDGTPATSTAPPAPPAVATVAQATARCDGGQQGCADGRRDGGQCPDGLHNCRHDVQTQLEHAHRSTTAGDDPEFQQSHGTRVPRI